MYQSEKRGGCLYPESMLNGFREVMEDSGQRDLSMEGYRFTWEKGRGTEEWVEERLDRVLASSEWRTMFPDAVVTNMPMIHSDHSPILLTLGREEARNRAKWIRYENAWSRSEVADTVLKRCWDLNGGLGLRDRLDTCRQDLRAWGTRMTTYFSKRTSLCKNKLNRLRGNRSEGAVEEFGRVREKLFEIVRVRREYWRQRAKKYYLEGANTNSKYFHVVASYRKRRNTIKKLKNGDGNWVEKGSGMEELMKEYFQTLLKSTTVEMDEVIGCIDASLTGE